MKVIINKNTKNIIKFYPDISDIPTLFTINNDIFNIQLGEEEQILDIPDHVIYQTIIGIDSEGKFIIDNTKTDDIWRSIKELRNKYLSETDWICSITDYNVPNKDSWVIYRQELRDITKQLNPFKITWPTRPLN